MSRHSPGSPLAKMDGCKCNARVNRNGDGAGTSNGGETLYIIDKRCPVHAEKEPRKPK